MSPLKLKGALVKITRSFSKSFSKNYPKKRGRKKNNYQNYFVLKFQKLTKKTHNFVSKPTLG